MNLIRAAAGGGGGRVGDRAGPRRRPRPRRAHGAGAGGGRCGGAAFLPHDATHGGRLRSAGRARPCRASGCGPSRRVRAGPLQARALDRSRGGRGRPCALSLIRPAATAYTAVRTCDARAHAACRPVATGLERGAAAQPVRRVVEVRMGEMAAQPARRPRAPSPCRASPPSRPAWPPPPRHPASPSAPGRAPATARAAPPPIIIPAPSAKVKPARTRHVPLHCYGWPPYLPTSPTSPTACIRRPLPCHRSAR
jgi:hypothetical protein